MPGLIGAIDRFVRAHFDAPSIRTNARDFLLINPIYSFECQAWRITAAIAAPLAAVQAIYHLTGVNNNKVAALNFNALRFSGAI